MISLFPYIGGKHRMAKEITARLKATGADTLVDVFGGSAAVLLNAGFAKRVYNDASADLANLFRVMSRPKDRADLIERLRWTPPCRRLFEEDYAVYRRGNFSFSMMDDVVERARATLYRALLSFGGKMRCGGFSCSTGDRKAIKEVLRYQRVQARLDEIGRFFSGTMIENLDCLDVIKVYGGRPGVVLFCDPPYFGTEHYYSTPFGKAQHVFLAQALNECKAAVVCTYYQSPEIDQFYPPPCWKKETVIATSNSQLRKGNKPKTEELILTKEARR